MRGLNSSRNTALHVHIFSRLEDKTINHMTPKNILIVQLFAPEKWVGLAPLQASQRSVGLIVHPEKLKIKEC